MSTSKTTKTTQFNYCCCYLLQTEAKSKENYDAISSHSD